MQNKKKRVYTQKECKRRGVKEPEGRKAEEGYEKAEL